MVWEFNTQLNSACKLTLRSLDLHFYWITLIEDMLIERAANLGIRSWSVKWRGTVIFQWFGSILFVSKNAANATHYSTVVSGQKKL